jgi:hypothetical protein
MRTLSIFVDKRLCVAIVLVPIPDDRCDDGCFDSYARSTAGDEPSISSFNLRRTVPHQSSHRSFLSPSTPRLTHVLYRTCTQPSQNRGSLLDYHSPIRHLCRHARTSPIATVHNSRFERNNSKQGSLSRRVSKPRSVSFRRLGDRELGLTIEAIDGQSEEDSPADRIEPGTATWRWGLGGGGC